MTPQTCADWLSAPRRTRTRTHSRTHTTRFGALAINMCDYYSSFILFLLLFLGWIKCELAHVRAYTPTSRVVFVVVFYQACACTCMCAHVHVNEKVLNLSYFLHNFCFCSTSNRIESNIWRVFELCAYKSRLNASTHNEYAKLQ